MNGKKVIVAGTGKSGICAAGLLLRNGARVVLFDENKELDKEKLLGNFESDAKPELQLGELTEEVLEGTSVMVISPGIPCDAAFVNRVREHGIPVWSEIELAYYFSKGTIAAITGTNGKTTTTTLVSKIFEAHQADSIVVGNIGIPFTKLADTTTEHTLIAAEISSFQLETIQDFRPHVSAILNLTPDHLNRHYTFDNYAKVKFDISENQTEEDVCVLNYDDPETVKRRNLVKAAKVVFFSKNTALEDGVYVKDQKIVVNQSGKEIYVLDLADIKILGDHNTENVLAAVAVSYYMGIPVETIRKVCTAFEGVEHRIEYVKTVRGVSYYNDSKGTNPDAAIKGIQAMKSKTLLIGGGYDKGGAFDEWIEAFDSKVKYLVLIGQTAKKIEETARKHGFQDIVLLEGLQEAVQFCYEHAEPGESVLLSPACASWGMFDNYEQRGDLFKQYVRELEE
jgi:UDP-N-acetylmuramoylalanine--D-glutamate ligase